MYQIGNEAPVGDITDQSVFASGTLSLNLADFYTDRDGDRLSYSITQSDGSDLPTWMSFDRRSLSGSPTSEHIGTISLTVTVDDSFGGILEDTFAVTVTQNVINGTVHSDSNLRGTNFSDEINGLDDDDTLKGFGADDTLDGGVGNDFMLGGSGGDTLTSISGFNRMLGQLGNDLMIGGADSDTLVGGAHDDTLQGGAGADRLAGRDGHDNFLGGHGNDIMSGGEGDDSLLGGVGDDTIFGGAGEDTLIGSRGQDKMIGGRGSDLFELSLNNGMDIIRDFKISEDQFRLESGLSFSDLSISQLGGCTVIEANGDRLALVVRTDATQINDSTLFS